MELYIGGYAQGKLSYVRKISGAGSKQILTDAMQISQYDTKDKIIFHRFHEWFLDRIKEGENPEDIMDRWLEAYKELVIICDEIGNGIVPSDALEREYRERLGRYLCRIAEQADRVERVLCGIGQRIK